MADRARPLKLITDRVRAAHTAVGEAWPVAYDPASGEWRTIEAPTWQGGYWIEMLRIAGERLDDWDLYLDGAARQARMRPFLAQASLLNAPAFYYGAARLYETLSDRNSRLLALTAAYATRTLADPETGAPPLGDAPEIGPYESFLLDWWALKETEDPTFLDGAERALDRLADESPADDTSATASLLRGWIETREDRFLEAGTARLERHAETIDGALLETLARLAVTDPPPDPAAPGLELLEQGLDALAARVDPTEGADSDVIELPRIYHFYAALHCLDAGGLPC